MNDNAYMMTPAEQTVSKCARLYTSYGYHRFLMNKFEDYSLYADNKSFLVDDRLLTFTDGGKLKALKPDITLSIVKNLAKDQHLPLKVFYNETVYRVKKGDREFSELHQMGLELIGDNSLYAVTEVVSLAKATLDAVNEQNILDISHMGILSALIDDACKCGVNREELTAMILQKNADSIATLLAQSGCTSPLATLVASYSPISEMIPVLKTLLPQSRAVCELAQVAEVLQNLGLDQNVYLDFSLMHDIGYYNGIIFKGYLKGVPVAVLSGGRYDPLLDRFGLSAAAIGFALYLDYIRYNSVLPENDVLLLYSEQDSALDVAMAMRKLTAQGKPVMAAAQAPANRSFSQILKVQEVLS